MIKSNNTSNTDCNIFCQIFNKYKLFTITSIGYLIASPFLLEYLQRYLICRGDCILLHGSFYGFVTVTIMIGWIVVGYVWALIYRIKLTNLLKILLPVSLIIYLVVTVIFFFSYVKATNSYIVQQNYTDHSHRQTYYVEDIINFEIENYFTYFSDSGYECSKRFYLNMRNGNKESLGYFGIDEYGAILTLSNKLNLPLITTSKDQTKCPSLVL